MTFDIPPQDLQQALQAWAQQAGLPGISGNDPKGIVVGPVVGDYTIEAALLKLLEGTGRTFTRAKEPGASYYVTAASTQTPRRRPEPPPPYPQPPVLPEFTPVDPLEEIEVETQRIRRQRHEPTLMVDGAGEIEIARLPNASTTADLLRYELLQPYSFPIGFRTSGAQFIEPVGLGINTGMTLLNSKWSGVTAAHSGDAFNINLLTPTAIERIELRYHGSADWLGSHAIDGVANLVFKTPSENLTTEIHYGGARGGANERRLTLSAGDTEGDFKGSVLIDHFTRDFLLGEERPLWNDQDYRRYGGTDQRTVSSSPGNVWSLTGGNLPGLNAPFAGVNESDGGGVSFTPGQLNLDSAHQSMSIVPATSGLTVLASGDLAVAKLNVFGEFLAINSETVFQSTSAMLQRALVPSSNAFNPLGVPVLASVRFEGVEPRQVVTDEKYVRGVVGVEGDAGRHTWKITLLHTDEHGSRRTFNELDPAALQAALAASDPTLALNVFASSPLPKSLIAAPRRVHHFGTGTQLTASLQSSLLDLSALKISAHVGGEWRREAVSFEDSFSADASRTLAAAYARTQVHLTDAQLHVDIEGRIDRYSDSAAVINPLYNISWEALSFLKLESSYRTSSRPASLFDLSRPTLTQTIPIADPRQNGAIATPVVRAGGNPLLEPARGESWTAGFTLSPWADVSLAANYWQLRMTHRPVTLPLMTFLENEAYFANRIERVSGTLRFIDVSNINLGRVKVSGIDVNIHALLQTKDYGDFRGKLSGKWFDEYSMEDIPGIVRVERVGLASPIGTIPRMKGLASLEWLGSTLSVKATVLHTAGYEDVSLGRKTGRSLSPQTILNLQGTVDFTNSSHMTEWLDGTRFTLGIQNVMDRSPDHADVGTAVGYDHSEWDLRQRFVFAGISKTFR